MDSAALPVLYSFRRCPYAMRARLALAVSGVPHEHREVVLRNKPAELLAASPKGTVPVLVLPNGQVIDESLDVMLWALRQNDPAHWLSPTGAALDDMLTLISVNDGAFKRNLDRYKYPNRYPQESGADAATFAHMQRDLGARWLDEMESRLAGGWLFGSAASLADMATLPFVRQFAHTDAAWFAAQPWPQLQAWLARFEASAPYVGIMQKLEPWQDHTWSPATPH
jgi:glutathione S-transferase